MENKQKKKNLKKNKKVQLFKKNEKRIKKEDLKNGKKLKRWKKKD